MGNGRYYFQASNARRLLVVIKYVLLLTSCLLIGCTQSVEPVPYADEQAVTIVAWSVPSILQVGQVGYLQVKLSPSKVIDHGIPSAESVNPSVTISPREFAIKDLQPILPGKNAPGHSPPEPPALGKTTINTFQITVSKPGDYPVEVKFVYRNTIARQIITIKGS
jgi:hypothetical protein